MIAMVLLLAGLPLLARPFLGPAGASRAARFLRVGTCAALLACLYLLIAWKVGGKEPLKILFLVLVALYVAAIFWMTSRRSRIAPATLAAGTGAGLALGLVMYAVAPLGLSTAATNPFLPGSDVDPLVLLAWLLLFCAPATAAMLRAAWLRDWLYHGPRLLYGVQNLSSDLRTLPAIAYSHELTGSVDAGVLNAIVIFLSADRAHADRTRSGDPGGLRRAGPGRPATRGRRPARLRNCAGCARWRPADQDR